MIGLFEFSKLNDVDYEMLCLDIMQRKLNTDLRVFPRGRDGGIDLTNDTNTLEVLIQVKHYERSSTQQLINSLNKEIDKVDKLNPKQYYVFTSKSLTPQNIKDIYSMFEKYMESEKNIITREDINKFLRMEENQDILRKHFKLWMTTDHVLKDLLNHNIFLDGEVLIHDIYENFEYFVQTSVFDKCIKILEKERKILLYGDPGVGKTINSYMLVLRYIKEGYQVRFSSSANIRDLKKAISANRNLKEVILLDDFLGQHYLNLKTKEDKEILSLIKHIDIYKNKVLILNSRVTILNHALSTSEGLSTYINKEGISIERINMNEISDIEKAKIFYNQLKRNGLSNKYYDNIREGKRYLNIINHKNYNPRIFEYVTLKKIVQEIEPHNYYAFIKYQLNHPEGIWKNEFEDNLSKIDRFFIFTLYSLTDHHVPIDIFKHAFEYIISTKKELDYTIDNFHKILSRLNESMVKIIENNGNRSISVLNPSLNDYMKEEISKNKLLHNSLINHAIYLEQLIRLYPKVKHKEILANLVKEHKLLKFNTISAYRDKKYDILLSLIAEHSILDDYYIQFVDLLPNMDDLTIIDDYRVSKYKTILNFITNKELREFYNIINLLSDYDNIDNIFDVLNFNESIELINSITDLFDNDHFYREDYIEQFIRILNDLIEDHIDNIDYRDYVDIFMDDFPKSELVIVNLTTDNIYNDLIDEISYIYDTDIQKALVEVLMEKKYLIKLNTEAAIDYFINSDDIDDVEVSNPIFTIDYILDRDL